MNKLTLLTISFGFALSVNSQKNNPTPSQNNPIKTNNSNKPKTAAFKYVINNSAWYYYNPATLVFGVSDFSKRWGNRQLTDNWRRSQK
jgi:hypothetical protein